MKPKTIKNMKIVFDKLMIYASEDKSNEKEIASAFNEMLDGLLDNDFFGTEGQCDPRGDQCR